MKGNEICLLDEKCRDILIYQVSRTSNLSNAFTFRKREELLQKSKEYEREGKQEQAWKLKGQAVEVTYDHIVAFVKVRERT